MLHADSHKLVIRQLLDELRRDFPRLKAQFDDQMRREGINRTIEQRVSQPTGLNTLPTFDEMVRRPLSPMLEARFKYAGSWQQGVDTWLAIEEIQREMGRRPLQSTHKSLRKHWENSAPMRFPDSSLSLFSITSGVPQDIVYLVWPDEETVEPELWVYAGMDETRHPTLADFLRSQLT